MRQGIRKDGVPRATKAEAEAGTNAHKLMTPARALEHLQHYGFGARASRQWPNGYDLNNLTDIKSGTYYRFVPAGNGTVALGWPFEQSTATNADHDVSILIFAEGPERFVQTLQFIRKNGVEGRTTYTRAYRGGWKPWVLEWTSGDAPASHAASGYQKLPSGLILQWGAVVIGNIGAGSYASSHAITFPVAFPTACLHVYTGKFGDASAVVSGTRTMSATGCNIYAEEWSSVAQGAAAEIMYLAVGY